MKLLTRKQYSVYHLCSWQSWDDFCYCNDCKDFGSIIVSFSTFQVSQALEILKYVLIQHIYPSTGKGQETTMFEQNSLHENYQNQNSLKTCT